MLESPLQHCMFRVPAWSSARMQHSQILSSGFYTETFTDNTHQIPTAFFVFARQPWCFLARQQVSPAALCQAAPWASDTGSAGGRAQVQPPFCETCSKSSWGHTGVLGRQWSTLTLVSQEHKLVLTTRIRQNLQVWDWRHGSSWPPVLETFIFPADCCICTAAEQTLVEMKRLGRIQHSSKSASEKS